MPVYIPTPAPGLGYGGPALSASGTITCLGVINNDAVSIGAITLVAGASQMEGGLNFNRIGTDGEVALSLAAAINAPGNGLSILVSALAIANVVSVIAKASGTTGNGIALSSNNVIRLAVSGSGFLTGGYGESGQYGYTAYGNGFFSRPPVATTGGFGGAEYGFGSFGALDTTPPRVTGSTSIDGYHIELFFSETMLLDAALLDPASYTLVPVQGAPTTITGVGVGTSAPGGCTSVVLTHSGTTTGGRYLLATSGLVDIAGNPVGPNPANSTACITLGDTATVQVVPESGTSVRFDFFQSDGVTPQPMLPEVEFTPGVLDPTNYSITTDYPLQLAVGSITHPYGSDSQVGLSVSQMTSTLYTATVGPSNVVVYTGSVVPSAEASFTGTELGVGTSTASSSSHLLLSKTIGNLYGWRFEDLSGRMLPAASFQMDFTFDTTTASFSPPLYDSDLGTLTISDGATQVDILFRRLFGVDVVDVVSGSFYQQVPANWGGSATTVQLLRNQKAGVYAVLLNGVPVVSAPIASFLGAPTIAPGVQFLLSATYTISTLKVLGVSLTATQTIYTSAWNFLHSVGATFTGSASLARAAIQTAYGPLVKTWGDSTPATKQDVAIRVNGTPVEIQRVNPYSGVIYPTIPIPLTPPGTNTVEVDYAWMRNPRLPFAGLNTPGLTLNSWYGKGRTTTSTTTSQGAARRSRFPMSLALVSRTKAPQPVLIGHRYSGFEVAYSALLNSPTTLRLNQNPHRIGVPSLTHAATPVSLAFDGTTTPPLAPDAWVLDGVDAGVVVGDGTYQLVDNSSGSFGVGTATVYYKAVDVLSQPSAVEAVARLQIESYTPDGVFTGVAFGASDNRHLHLAGFLEVNGVKHIGLLTDASLPHLASSWEIGPSTLATVVSSNVLTISSTNLPSFVIPGSRFQIFSGNQTGVYQIATCGVDDYNGLATLTLNSNLPADYTLEGNDTATLYFEVLWEASLTTYRLITDTVTHVAVLYVGGTLQGEAVTALTTTANPAQTSLLVPTGNTGRVLFGSLSRVATNSTIWSTTTYVVNPNRALFHARGIVVAAEMLVLPEVDENPWFLTQGFGQSQISSGLLLKSTSASSTLDLSYGYARIEPFLTTKSFLDVDATFRVESGVLGGGDAQIRVKDDQRQAILSTLLYSETGSSRQLISLPSVSFSGLRIPDLDGWTSVVPFSLSTTVHQNLCTITQTLGQSGVYSQTLNLSSGNLASGYVLDFRVAVTSYTANALGYTGTTASATTDGGVQVVLVLKAPVGVDPAKVALFDSTLTEVAAAPFTWTDGAFHSYRLVSTGANVSLFVDDTLLATFALALFLAGGVPGAVSFGAMFTDVASVSVWDSLYVHPQPGAALKRTLGVYVSGPEDDIDSWRISRTDGTSALNSSPTAAPVEMDWTSDVQVRVHWDPTWGVSIYRPDLGMPPWYTGAFASKVTDPTAAWINVEYPQLPTHNDTFGSVAFGALDARSVTQQRWTEIRYRIYNTPDENFIAPQHMVLNRYNRINSGEGLRDVTPEVVTVQSLTSTMASVRSANMNASRVFVVVVDNAVVANTLWSFNVDTQTIQFVNPLPSNSYPVTITFSPGNPVTQTYLDAQPLEASPTQLNEGTPPIPLSQVVVKSYQVVTGTPLTDPQGTTDTITGPLESLQYSMEGLYASMQFTTTDNGGVVDQIASADDGPAPGQGWIGIDLGGSLYQDRVVQRSPLNQMQTLNLSGGRRFIGGTLGMVLHPNYPGPTGPHRGQVQGAEQEILMGLSFTYAETLTVSPTADNTPPSLPTSSNPNPDGTPGVHLHGAVFAEQVDYGVTGVSRLGPWGGITSLTTDSLLGGGGPLLGAEFTLQGGFPLTPPSTTTFVIDAAV